MPLSWFGYVIDLFHLTFLRAVVVLLVEPCTSGREGTVRRKRQPCSGAQFHLRSRLEAIYPIQIYIVYTKRIIFANLSLQDKIEGVQELLNGRVAIMMRAQMPVAAGMSERLD
jgi:hypothetical protein